jgi:signal transduction histidine kinase
MYQEIIKNIIKHSSANIVEFILSKNDNNIVLAFTDNGVGFEYSQITKQEIDGIGLRSLNTRAKYFNGSVDIKSVLQKGTTISIFIPVS